MRSSEGKQKFDFSILNFFSLSGIFEVSTLRFIKEKFLKQFSDFILKHNFRRFAEIKDLMKNVFKLLNEFF